MSPLQFMGFTSAIYLVSFMAGVLSMPMGTKVVKTKIFFADDMILNSKQRQALEEAAVGQSPSRVKRNVVYVDEYRWPNRTIPYKIDEEFSLKEKIGIFQAMHHIESMTCIRFQQVYGNSSKEKPHVFIKASSACNSEVGYQNKPVQFINLWPFQKRHPGCMHFGIIVHELLHTLGFYHQQSSGDRDKYVRIVYENITPGQEYNFLKYPPGLVSDFHVGYDFSSIMHYEPFAFSRNGKPTIEALQPYRGTMGQRKAMSAKDVLKLNHLYDCKEQLSRTLLNHAS